jgi:ribosomal protein L4
MVERATRNIAELKVVSARYLNVFDVLNADTIVISQKSLDEIGDWLGSKK